MSVPRKLSVRHSSSEIVRNAAAIRGRARELREQATVIEFLIWSELRGRKLAGLKFRRQHPIGPFVVDFYCAEHQLVVELDGPVHDERQDDDRQRSQYLRQRG